MAENFCHPSWLHKMRAHSGIINMEATTIACNGILSIKLKHMIAGMLFFSKAISSPPAGNKHPSSSTLFVINPWLLSTNWTGVYTMYDY
jgi:hypothetical protein